MTRKKPDSFFKVGAPVEWKWLGRAIQGRVLEVHRAPVTKKIKGKTIKRNGSDAKPAYLVESQAGNLALKLQSELSAPTTKSRRTTPKMFAD